MDNKTIEILEDLLASLWNHYRGAIEPIDEKRTMDRIEAIVDVLNYLKDEGEYN